MKDSSVMSLMSEPKYVLMVCLGNICRSPIAEAVFKHIVKEKGFEDQWSCDSAAMGSWHTGSSMDPRAAAVLVEHGITPNHRARQVTTQDFHKFDFIFGMDHENIKALKNRAPAGSKAEIHLLGSFDPKGKTIIRDPFYDDDTSGFEECYQTATRACSVFLDKFSK